MIRRISLNTIVHKTQTVYRQLINVSSRPGHIETVEEELSNYTDFSKANLLTCVTLFDNEITYMTTNEVMEKEVKVLTGARKAHDLSTTDYIISKRSDLKEEFFTQTKHGVLASPEKSVTILIDLDSLNEGQTYQLTGPGIKDTQTINIDLDPSWIELRNQACQEFPLGLDLILTDKNNQLMMIPRTTKVEVR